MKKYFQRKIKIVITEDQMLMRKSLITLLSEFKDFEIIGEYSNGKELIDALKNHTIEPDIVLLDIRMPIMDGYETLDLIRKRYDFVNVIMLSMHDDPSIILDLIKKGANGFISKYGEPDELIRAINTVFKEGHYFDKNTSQAMFQKITSEKTGNPFTDSTSLSDREIAVMKEICDGHSNKVISERLYISSRTVDFHKANIYRKIKSKKVTDVVKYALRNGIIQLPLR